MKRALYDFRDWLDEFWAESLLVIGLLAVIGFLSWGFATHATNAQACLRAGYVSATVSFSFKQDEVYCMRTGAYGQDEIRLLQEIQEENE